jgi:flagellar biosynthesis protein FlhF
MEVDVKIKRYLAASMRAALSQIRAEQGPDAVILSTRRVSEGIEVIAAVDYDEALMAGAARRYVQAASPSPASAAESAAGQRASDVAESSVPAARAAKTAPAESRPATTRPTTAPAKAPTTGPAAMRPAVSNATSASPAAVPRAASPICKPAPATDTGLAIVQRELTDMRVLLESGLANLSWHDRRQREPLRASVLEQLSAMDIAPDVAAALAAQAPAHTKLKDTSKLPLALLLQHLPVVDGLSTVTSGVIAIVGPTGAGKTTTIAKLASHWAMRHGSQDLALVSTDAYRIGAREQLMTYARILGASMHAPNSGKELERVLERCKSKRLVLIDTAGMGPRDVRLAEQLSALKRGAPRAKVFLALPAHGEVHALEEIIRAFSPISPSACIITKVDESASLGAVLSAAVRNRLKIAYLCNGQRVPEDLHLAHQKRVWLVRAARKLTERAQPRGEAYLARNFGRGQAHA